MWKQTGALVGLCLGGLVLGGCGQTYQAATYAPAASLSRTAQYETLYGSAAPSEFVRANPAPAPRRAAETASREVADAPIVYSEEWNRREQARETKLKQSSAICRC